MTVWFFVLLLVFVFQHHLSVSGNKHPFILFFIVCKYSLAIPIAPHLSVEDKLPRYHAY